MSIDFTGTYGIFTKLGLLGGFLSKINQFQKDLITVKSPEFITKFTGNAKTKVILGYIPEIDLQIESVSNITPNLLVGVAASIVIDSVRSDDPIIPEDLSLCLAELVKQMEENNIRVRQVTNTITTTQSTPEKSVVLIAPVNERGLENQFILAETLRLEVSSDSYTGGAAAGNESFTISTANTASSIYNYDYPAGSGASDTFNRVNVTASLEQGNLVTNGTFLTASTTTPTAPESWTAISPHGVAGVNWATSVDGLKITGNATSSVRLRQDVSTSVTGRTVYGFHFRVKAPVALTTGYLTLDLIDESGTILTSDTNTMLAYSVSLNQVGTSFTEHTGYFVTGTKTPSVVYLRIMATAESGAILYVDRLALTQMQEMYGGGPYVAVFGVSTNPLSQGERISINITKALKDGSGTIPYTNNTFQMLFDRLFSTGVGGFTLPFSSTPNVADTLIN